MCHHPSSASSAFSYAKSPHFPSIPSFWRMNFSNIRSSIQYCTPLTHDLGLGTTFPIFWGGGTLVSKKGVFVRKVTSVVFHDMRYTALFWNFMYSRIYYSLDGGALLGSELGDFPIFFYFNLFKSPFLESSWKTINRRDHGKSLQLPFGYGRVKMAKEMHLVDPKMLERMITPLEPKQRVLNQLDREMQVILER